VNRPATGDARPGGVPHDKIAGDRDHSHPAATGLQGRETSTKTRARRFGPPGLACVDGGGGDRYTFVGRHKSLLAGPGVRTDRVWCGWPPHHIARLTPQLLSMELLGPGGWRDLRTGLCGSSKGGSVGAPRGDTRKRCRTSDCKWLLARLGRAQHVGYNAAIQNW